MNQPTTAPAAKPASEIGQLVIARKNDIAAMGSELQKILPTSLPADKFVRTAQTAIMMNPQIAQCDKQSVLTACMKAASDGLILDGREAALTVYNVNKGTKENPKWEKQAQYMPMVTGIIKRVRQSGEVSRFNAFPVHKNDLFKVRYGLEMAIEHEPNFNDPGPVIGCYAMAQFKDGLDDFEYMTVNQIESIRARSKSPDRGPWKTDYEEMCKKTVMRRMSKRLPMSSDLRNVVQRVDDLYEKDEDAGETIDHSTGEIMAAEKPKATRARKSAAEKMAGEVGQGTPADGIAPTQKAPAPAFIAKEVAAKQQQAQAVDAEYEEVADDRAAYPQGGNVGDDDQEDII